MLLKVVSSVVECKIHLPGALPFFHPYLAGKTALWHTMLTKRAQPNTNSSTHIEVEVVGQLLDVLHHPGRTVHFLQQLLLYAGRHLQGGS